MFIRWIVIYPVDSAIQRLNNRDLTQCLAGWLTEWRTDIDYKTVRIFAYSSTREHAVEQKVRNKAENRERDWGVWGWRAKTLTPRFTDFFTDFEKKKPTVLQSRTDMVGLLSYCLQLAHSWTDDHWSDLLITHSL